MDEATRRAKDLIFGQYKDSVVPAPHAVAAMEENARRAAAVECRWDLCQLERANDLAVEVGRLKTELAQTRGELAKVKGWNDTQGRTIGKVMADNAGLAKRLDAMTARAMDYAHKLDAIRALTDPLIVLDGPAEFVAISPR